MQQLRGGTQQQIGFHLRSRQWGISFRLDGTRLWSGGGSSKTK